MTHTPEHTPEPWAAQKCGVYWYPQGGTVDDGYRPVASCHDEAWSREQGRDTYAEDCDNAARIVACVNALAGIRNPAAVRDVRDAANAVLDGFDRMKLDGESGDLTATIDFRTVRRLDRALAALDEGVTP